MIEKSNLKIIRILFALALIIMASPITLSHSKAPISVSGLDLYVTSYEEQAPNLPAADTKNPYLYLKELSKRIQENKFRVSLDLKSPEERLGFATQIRDHVTQEAAVRQANIWGMPGGALTVTQIPSQVVVSVPQIFNRKSITNQSIVSPLQYVTAMSQDVQLNPQNAKGVIIYAYGADQASAPTLPNTLWAGSGLSVFAKSGYIVISFRGHDLVSQDLSDGIETIVRDLIAFAHQVKTTLFKDKPLFFSGTSFGGGLSTILATHRSRTKEEILGMGTYKGNGETFFIDSSGKTQSAAPDKYFDGFIAEDPFIDANFDYKNATTYDGQSRNTPAIGWAEQTKILDKEYLNPMNNLSYLRKPVLLLQSTQDDNVSPQQSVNFAKKAKKLGKGHLISQSYYEYSEPWYTNHPPTYNFGSKLVPGYYSYTTMGPRNNAHNYPGSFDPIYKNYVESSLQFMDGVVRSMKLRTLHLEENPYDLEDTSDVLELRIRAYHVNRFLRYPTHEYIAAVLKNQLSPNDETSPLKIRALWFLAVLQKMAPHVLTNIDLKGINGFEYLPKAQKINIYKQFETNDAGLYQVTPHEVDAMKPALDKLLNMYREKFKNSPKKINSLDAKLLTTLR